MPKVTVQHGSESIPMQEVSTVGDVLERLSIEDSGVITVDDKVAAEEYQLRDGDVVKILPRAGKNNA